MDAFTAAIALLVGAVVLMVVRAVRQTRGRSGRGTDPERRDAIDRDLATGIRDQGDRVRCVRCGGPTFAMAGTATRYKCEVCQHTFEGPPHLPDPGP